MHHADIELFSEPLIDYLTNRGWTLMESEPDIAILRKFFGDQEEEILLPVDRTYSDYHQRIREAIQFLVKCEHRSKEDIVEELLFHKWSIEQKLKPQTEVSQEVFVGKVLALCGEADEHGQMQGEVTLYQTQ